MPSDTFLNLDKEKQKRILKGASEVFLKKSFDEAKVVEICKSANIPRVSFYNKLTDYFVNIIDSELGLRVINDELDRLSFQDKIVTNYMISLGVQYKSGVISKEELMIKAGEMLNNIQN